MVWRRWAQEAIDGVIDNQDLLRKEVNKAVTRMMARLPDTLRNAGFRGAAEGDVEGKRTAGVRDVA